MATTLKNEFIPGWSADDPSLERLDVELLARAYRFSAAAHEGQFRRNGDPFVTHCVEVARILAELQLDSVTVAAGLIHDVVEDTAVTIEEVEAEFGVEIMQIVDGLTKIGVLPLHSSEERQVENYRKLLVSIAKDARVIIIKLADRLHNMRTLDSLPEDKQRRISLETRDLYAPLAHRFGMAKMRWELEDLAFKFLEPEDFRSLVVQVSSKKAAREQMIIKLRTPLEYELRRAAIDSFDITGRPKHLWSIFQKMKRRNKGFDEIYDLMALRVIVKTVPECYHALGIIHHNWTPLQERIKDYIASPKSNGYQSLHTTIFGPGGQLFEVQIRTQEMHRTAEYGIAAHWIYKTDGSTDEVAEHLGWFRQLLELQQDTHSPEEFLEFLKVDLYQDEIFVFTPQGDVKQLPKGATPIDFAYHVHTKVGEKCQGAKINGRIAPLHRELKNGDTVEILTGPSAKPSRDWLNHVRTARARHKIKQWIKHEEETVSLQLGQEILDRELKKRRLSGADAARMERAAASLSLADARGLTIAIGRGDVAIGQVVRALFPDAPLEELQEPKPTVFGRVIDRIRLGRGIKIQGVDGLMVRYAQCCQPVPGDKVVGYVTQGRGISIHRSDCPNLLTLSADDRRVEIDWHETTGESFVVRLDVNGNDRRGLYADLMQAVSASGTNIKAADINTRDGAVFGNVFIEVDNLPHLEKVMKAMRRVKGVQQVDRHEEGQSSASKSTG